jgi:endogenous inhibitor of DNA gyrase (YacG/DUF329 family)
MGSTEKSERCPMCDRPSASKKEKHYPFCSLRCQLDDLGRWLNENYRIPKTDDPD